MSFLLSLLDMSREDKLRAMEALWEDLSRDDKSFDSPAWHRQALGETEARVKEGKEAPLDWETAKKDLRRRFE